MKPLALLLLIILQVSTAAPAEMDNDLKGLHWLIGHWQGQLDSAVYDESWELTGHGTLEGRAAMMNPTGKTILTEVLRIEKIGAHIVYIASVNNHPPVLFTLIEISQDNDRPKWVFENKEHDFPQQVIYIRESMDSLLARVEGLQKGKVEREEFRLNRKRKN